MYAGPEDEDEAEEREVVNVLLFSRGWRAE
jgi:hypothetical protein